jgi:hypothetical protein
MTTIKLITKLVDSAGNPLPGKTITFYYSYDGVSYTQISQSVTDSTGTATATHTTSQKTYYKAYFAGDSQYDPSSATAVYTPSVTQQITQFGWIWLILLLIFLLLLFSSRRGSLTE